jgi:hypothetical protein
MTSERNLRRDQSRINRERREEKRRFLRQRVAALHAEGLDTRAIAQRLQLSRTPVLETMRALGLTPHRGGT